MPDEKAGWRIKMKRQPAKMLRRLPKPLLTRIRDAVWDLAHDPYPPGSRKLVGYKNLYRIRVGDWRVVYTIRDAELVILIVRVAPRGSAYHNL